MTGDEDFKSFVQAMEGTDVEAKAIWLIIRAERPSGELRYLPYLEACLTDLTPCIISQPYYYAELRWVAAHALIAERVAAGIQQPVHCEGVLPMSTDELSRAVEASGIDRRKDRRELKDYIPDLREAGLVTLVDLELTKPVGRVVPWKTEQYPTGGYPLSKRTRR